MNCVGVDVSKGKSIIAIIRPLGEMEIPPFEVGLTDAELCELPRRLGDLDGETRVVMEATGNYHLPVASFLYASSKEIRLFLSMVCTLAHCWYCRYVVFSMSRTSSSGMYLGSASQWSRP